VNIWRGPVSGAALPDTLPLVRDEEAAGSNPATPTEKLQADGMIAKCGDHAIDHLLAPAVPKLAHRL
jgi:hypothetical protein